MATESRLRANAKYESKKYDKIMIRVAKGRKESIKQSAEAAEVSLNAYITEAITEKMERDSRGE